MAFLVGERCAYCRGRIPALRRLTDRRFCSEAHRRKFEAGEPDGSIVSSAAPSLVKPGTEVPAGTALCRHSVLTYLAAGLIVATVSAAAPFFVTEQVGATGGVAALFRNELHRFRQAVASRAGINLYEDFADGFNCWIARDGAPPKWTRDDTSFVHPRALAFFQPAAQLTDYRLDLLGQLDRGALGCAFRAADYDNYYAMRVVVLEPGPLPVVAMERYAVIDGKMDRLVRERLPGVARSGAMYRISLNVRGADFTLSVQGHIAGCWTDNRLPRGGVGLFSDKAGRGRVRSLRISRQWDAVGRVCALLASSGDEKVTTVGPQERQE